MKTMGTIAGDKNNEPIEKIKDSKKFKAAIADSKEFIESLDKGVNLFLTDPPYNKGKDYGDVTDNRDEEDYKQLISSVLSEAYEKAEEGSSFFFIHYPEDVAKLFELLTEEWDLHQWLTWCYPSNYGHSDKKWTNASRAIIWLKKGDEPKFYPERIVQKYKNPKDSRIRDLFKEGELGTHLYDWIEINHCKNVSKDYKGYSNQIPEKLLKLLIVSTTDRKDRVVDPFAGTYSTCRVALKAGRYAAGSDLNKDTREFAEEIDAEDVFNSYEGNYPLLLGSDYELEAPDGAEHSQFFDGDNE